MADNKNIKNFYNNSNIENNNYQSYHNNMNFENNLSNSNINVNINNNNNFENEKSEFFSILEQPKFLRCDECFSIPLIYSVFLENKQIILIYKCKCMKYNEIKPMEITLFLNKMNSTDIFSQVCFFCKKKKESMILCKDCKQEFEIIENEEKKKIIQKGISFCRECIFFHNEQYLNHTLVDFENIDNYCEKHVNNNCFAFDLYENRNICEICLEFCEQNNLEFYDSYIPNEKEFEEVCKTLYLIKKKIFLDDINVHQTMCKKFNDEQKKNAKAIFFNNNVNNKNIYNLGVQVLSTFNYGKKNNKLNFQICKNFCTVCKNMFVPNQFNINQSYDYYCKYLLDINNIIKKDEHFNLKNNIKPSQAKILSNRANIKENIIEDEQSLLYNQKLNINAIPINYQDNTNSDNISSLINIKSFGHTKLLPITSVILLHNQRIAIGVSRHIEIMNPDTFQTELIIRGHKNTIFSMIQLNEDEHRIVSGDINGEILFWRFNENSSQNFGKIIDNNGFCLKLEQIQKDYLVCITSEEINIFKKEFPYNKVYNEKNKESKQFTLIESNNYIIYVCFDLIFYKLEKIDENKIELKKEKTLNNVKNTGVYSITKIDEKLIAVGGKEVVYLIDTEKLIIKKRIGIIEPEGIISLCYTSNKTLLLGFTNFIKEYDIKSCIELASVENAHQGVIMIITEIGKDLYATCGLEDKKCYFWKKIK